MDNPIVDKNSERSEESVLAVRGIFTRKNGFISKEESPDYGVDFDVELISENGATSNMFPIQIKSGAKLDFIKYKDDQFISIEFFTSRLGYLCKRPPAYGLITVYDEHSKTTYYDYVEDIVNRLTSHRDSEDWKSQDKVNIRLPLNVLNQESALEIHKKFTIRFSDHAKMLAAQGTLYGIPSFIDQDKKEIDFNDLKQVEELLIKHGLGLFNDKDYDMIISLLGKLSTITISRSKELTLLGVITYGQSGMIMECDYYLQKSKQHEGNYTKDDKLLIDYNKLTNKLKKGDIDYEGFAQGLRELQTSVEKNNSINSITIEINLIYSRLIENHGKADSTILYSINLVFDKISKSELKDTDRLLLKLFNLENLHNYGTQLFLRDAGKFKLQEKLGIRIPLDERIKRVRSVLEVLNSATGQVEDIRVSQTAKDNKIVNAYASYYRARFFFLIRFNSMMLSVEETFVKAEEAKKIYEGTLILCYQAIQYFSELALWHDTHQALCCAYDLQVLYKLLYNDDVGQFSIEKIEDDIRKLELGTSIPHFESNVAPIFKELLSQRQNKSDKWNLVPEDQIEEQAQIILDAYELPQERLVNIIHDFNSLNKFYKECSNPDLELMQDLRHQDSKLTRYATLPLYCIESKKSNIRSKWSSNIDELLEQFSTILKK